MILATGNSPSAPGRSGFTLIEILLVIALIAVAFSVVLINFTAFADRGESRSPEEALSAAIREARFIAAAERITTTLSYDEETGTLQIDPSEKQFPINSDFGPEGRGQILFFLIPSGQGLGRLPDPDFSQMETPSVAFAPDRSSTPFIVEIDSGRGSPDRLRFDPFSSSIITDE